MKTSELVGMTALLIVWAFSVIPAIKNFKLIYKNESVPPIGNTRRALLLAFYAFGFVGVFLVAALFIYKIQGALFS